MKKATGFEKFANRKKAGTIKEEHRKEKRVEKKERSSAIEQRFEEKRKFKLIKPADRPHAIRTAKAAEEALGRGAKKGTAAPPAGGKELRGPKSREIDARDTGARRSEARSKEVHGKDLQRREVRASVARGKETRGSEARERPGPKTPATVGAGLMPLNKYIAHSGVCARRDAALLVKEGVVTVNGKPVTEPGFKVNEGDEVKVRGKRISLSRNLVYILLNKPKDYITTTDDPQERKTVMDLIKTATDERIYPVGRLDRNTSGVLLLTNDGELAQALSHPKNQVKKIYEVKLDKPLTKHDFETISKGITLEDGFIMPDAMGYADPRDKSVIGIEIHSGRNRIVRRIFEHLQYEVKGLDRVMYAGLTKKNVNRGKWRLLVEKEIRLLKHFTKGTINKDTTKKSK